MSHTPSPLRPRREAPDSEERTHRPGGTRAEARAAAGERPPTATHATGEPFDEEVDWARLGAFGAGIALGALLGAGAALLLAPQSGPETRRGIARRARGVREDAVDAWDDLADQLAMLRRSARRSLRRKRREARRSVTKGRWAVEDALVD